MQKIMLSKTFIRLTLSKRTKLVLLFFILSLVCHVIIADLFFEYGFQSRVVNFVQALGKQASPSEKIKIIEQKQHQREALQKVFQTLHQAKPIRQGKLVAAHSKFGWTLFENAPSTVQQAALSTTIPTTMTGEVAVSAADHATEDTEINETSDSTANAQAETVKATVEVSDDNSPEAQNFTNAHATKTDQTFTDNAQPKIAANPIAAAPTKTNAIAEQTLYQASTNRPNIPDIDAQQAGNTMAPVQQAVASLIAAPSKEERIAKIEQLTYALASGDPFSFIQKKTPAKQLTAPAATAGKGPRRSQVRGAVREDGNTMQRGLITLTKGFIEKFDGENGTDLIDRDGEEGVKPDYSELKYIMYESKINWCLQAAWKQNFERKFNMKPLEGVAFIAFTMDKKGYVVASELLQSTGHTELDTIVMKTLTLASPFPPLPSYFNSEKYETGRRFIVTCNQSRF